MQLEYSKNDIQSTEEDVHGSLKQVSREDNDNDENTKYDKIKRSKVCTCNGMIPVEVEKFALKR